MASGLPREDEQPQVDRDVRMKPRATRCRHRSKHGRQAEATLCDGGLMAIACMPRLLELEAEAKSDYFRSRITREIAKRGHTDDAA